MKVTGGRGSISRVDWVRNDARNSAFEASWCCAPTAWLGKYVYQALILEKWDVQVIFLEQPLTDDPQALPVVTMVWQW